MSATTLTLQLREPQTAKKVLDTVAWPWIKNMLIAGGHQLTLTVKLQKRTNDQSAKFHAICGDVAKSGMVWAGKTRTAIQWKVLLVSGHSVATKEECEVIPGLENEFINIRESTALMSIKRGASLISYALAFCDLNNIKLSEPFFDPETGEVYQ